MENLLKRLENHKIREKIKTDTRENGDKLGGSVAACLMEKGQWDKIWFYMPERLRGKTIADIAAETSTEDPYDVLLDIILEEKGAIQGRTEPLSQADIDYTTNHPLCGLITDGTHDSPKLQTSGIPFIKGKHISSGEIDFNNCDHITEQDHIKCIQRVKPQKYDVLLANIGSVGDVALVKDDREFSIKNVALLRPNEHKISQLYFYYLVKN